MPAIYITEIRLIAGMARSYGQATCHVFALMRIVTQGTTK
jgi:hypothetical protein